MIGFQGKNNGKSALRFDKVNFNGRIMTLPKKILEMSIKSTI
jgi:hypothetical protein